MEPQLPNPEQVVSQWEQPTPTGSFSSKGTGRLWLIVLPIAALLISLAVWQHEVNYGLAAGVLLVAVFALQSQNRSRALPITVTTTRIVVGKREYPLADIAGFWLDDHGDVVEVNIENKKPGLLPLTFLYAVPSAEEARSIFSQIIPELEPREKKLGDRLGNYFRL